MVSASNANARLEAFCEGVFAIALTLLIIDVKLPVSETIESTAAAWSALRQLTRSIFALVLSFSIILITWVNHHAALKLVERTSVSFIYANGFLLLTVVFIPFPTSLLGEFLLTDHAVPAVVLYDGVLALQSIGWILLTGSALRNQLSDAEDARATMRQNPPKWIRRLCALCPAGGARVQASPRCRDRDHPHLDLLAPAQHPPEARLTGDVITSHGGRLGSPPLPSAASGTGHRSGSCGPRRTPGWRIPTTLA